jgi:hypothetical protein
VADLEPTFPQQAWDCGCTFQCTHDQPVFDLLFVTYSGELEAQWDNSKLGTFVVQVKLRANAAANTLVNQLMGPSIGGNKLENKMVMFLDLGTDAQFADKKKQSKYVYSTVIPPNCHHSSGWNSYIAHKPKQWCINVWGHGVEESMPS